MQLLFGKPLQDVTAEDVEAFLADATEEGLTWEAKGTVSPPARTVRKAVAGFANATGGYLIVGAEQRDDKSWHLPGVSFEVEEPGTWASSVITSGMSPLPPFDTKTLDRDEGRRVLVVEVEPVSVPPCVTNDGVLYQRVSGQTKPVTDPAVLGELLRRGETARVNAEATAARAALGIVKEPGILTAAETLFSVALSPAMSVDDKAAVLFTKSFYEQMEKLVRARLQADPMLGFSVGGLLQQNSLRQWTTSEQMGAGWTAAAYWDGAVAATFSDNGGEFYLAETIQRVHQGWEVLAELAEVYGGRGEAHLYVLVQHRHKQTSSKLTDPIELRRWTEVRAPREAEKASVERELERAFGRPAFEPEPE